MKNGRTHFYRQKAEAGSLISADYNQAVLAGFYSRMDRSAIRRICDVGSGMGCNLPLLAAQFCSANLFSMDLSFAALCHGRSSTAAVSPCAADAAGLPLLAGTIDLLVCTEVLEHVADLDAVLTELHRVVRSGGFCIVSSPNYLNPMGLRKWFKDRRLGAEFWDPWGGHQGYERLMLPSHVDRALRKHFAILEIRGAGFLMAWTALGYGRIGRKNDRHPWLALGRAPVFRNIAMNRYLLLKRKVAGNERI